MPKPQKPVALAVCTALAGGVALAGSAFAMTPLAQGYLLGAQQAQTADKAADAAKDAEGSCGADMKRRGQSGEGMCGMDKMDTDKDGKISKANSPPRTTARTTGSPPTTPTATASSTPPK